MGGSLRTRNALPEDSILRLMEAEEELNRHDTLVDTKIEIEAD